MANKKFSEFVLKTSTSDVSHIVGYNGAENVQITPANFLDTTGGPYLPLAGGTMTGTNGVVFPDNFYLNLGTSSDFEIYHDGNNSYLKDQGTGELILASNGTGIKLEKTSGEKMIHALTDGAVELYFDSVKKLETTSTGISVTGQGNFTGTVSATATATNAAFKLLIDDSRIEFANSATYLQGGGNLTLQAAGSLSLGTAGVGALLLDASQNATFDGSVTIKSNKVLTLNNVDNTNGFQLYNSGATGSTNSNLIFLSGAVGERMRIDSSGNVGIGQTSIPSTVLLDLKEPDAGSDLIIGLTAGTGARAQIRSIAQSLGSTAELSFYTVTGNTASEKMRLTSVGKLQVQTSGGYYLTENTTNAFSITSDGANGSLIFTDEYNSSERMRLSSAGDLLIGRSSKTSSPTFGSVYIAGDSAQNSTNYFAQMFIEHSSITNHGLVVKETSTGGIAVAFLNSSDAVVGQITTTATSTGYATSSDYRLKEDLQDFKGLDLVSKIPVYDYKWKADKSRSYGVMAHELEEVLPQAVSGEKDAEEMQSVDYSKIVPLLVKSIQELSAKLEALECQCEKK